MKSIASGEEVALDFLRLTVGAETDFRACLSAHITEIVDAHVVSFEENLPACSEARIE